MLQIFNKKNTYKPFADLSKTVIINSIASVSFAVVILVFSLVRTSLISNVYGVASIGFLAIAVSILPYISSTHGGATYVSRYNLYNHIYQKNYEQANEKIANLKIQYYFFGSIYAIITIAIAFAFPFFFNSNGIINVENEINHIHYETQLQWYETTLYILSNCVETLSNYFIIPISIILFFIIKKSYISNFLNIAIAIIANGLVITLLLLQKYNIIDINFLIMNTIITCILGIRIVILVCLLKPIRTRKITWYKRKKITNRRISKDMVISIITQYFKQFNTDLYSIVFILAVNYLPHAHHEPHNEGILLLHGDHGHGSHSNFEIGGIYSIVLLLITSSYEVVHSIMDNAVPSMAEHLTQNKKIHKTFFNRYNALITYIVTYTITTYIFTVGLSTVNVMNIEHLMNEEIILIFIITIPFFIDIKASSYDHIIPIYGNFNKIFKYTLIKVVINIIAVAVMACSLCFAVDEAFLQSALFIAIVFGWSISSFVYLILNKRFVNKIMDEKIKFNLLAEIRQNLYIILSLLLMALIFGFGTYKFNNIKNIETIGNWTYLIIPIVAILNFVLVFWYMKFACKSEYNFYLKEFKCMINHHQYDVEQIKQNAWMINPIKKQLTILNKSEKEIILLIHAYHHLTLNDINHYLNRDVYATLKTLILDNYITFHKINDQYHYYLTKKIID